MFEVIGFRERGRGIGKGRRLALVWGMFVFWKN